MDLITRLLNGVENGVNRQWRYTKNLLRIKPEYLLTISVADELTEGFDNISGLDVIVKVEEPVHSAANWSFFNAVGIKHFFQVARECVNRSGKADIYIEVESKNRNFVVELKGLDPNASEVKKELYRFISFLTIYGGNTQIESCHLVFPSLTDKESWLKKQVKAVKLPKSLGFKIDKRSVETHESPEDGIPHYYGNVLSIMRV